MTYEISSLDLMALIPELKALEGGRVDKIYQKENELIIRVYKSGDKKYWLILAPGKVFLTRYKREVPEVPPNFCMFLRKYLMGKYISKIRQRGFDRILEIYVDPYILVCELFGSGNFILIKDGKILAAMSPRKWRDRSIFKGEVYKGPPSCLDPRIMDFDSFLKIKSFEKSIVSALSVLFGIGGIYAEEILFRLDINKNKSCSELSDSELKKILEELNLIILELEENLKPQIVYKENMPLAVTPIDFKKFSHLEKKEFTSFSLALDEYFTNLEKKEYKERKEEPYTNEVEKLKRIRNEQIEALSKLNKEYEKSREKANLIYKNYNTVENIINALNVSLKNLGKSEILKRIEKERNRGIREAETISSIDFANKTVILDLGPKIEIDLALNVEKNAEIYYELSKRAKKKIEGLKSALEETEKRLLNLEKIGGKKEEREGVFRPIYGSRKKFWFESFRWFFSSKGFLVLGGRDSTSNEILVKKYTENQDLIMHADLPGSPFVVIKSGRKEVPEETLKEGAVFGVSYSSAWGKGLGSCDIYYVKPEQLVKVPGLLKGSFQIQGKRNYFHNVSLELAVGILEKNSDFLIMGGPISAVKKYCKHYVKIKQGMEKKSDIAKKIKGFFDRVVDFNFDLDEIIRALPPGNCEIVEME